jgi:hypothetical protein
MASRSATLPLVNGIALAGGRHAESENHTDFFVGDDWTVAVGVVLALAAMYGLSRAGVAAWWITPVAVVILLGASVRRAARSRN